MYQRNDCSTNEHNLQNQFTAYLQNALHNKRIDYIYKNHFMQAEILMEDMDRFDMADTEYILKLAEFDALEKALQNIKERKRYILLARVIEEKSFSQIAEETGLSYKGTASIYYRTLGKLRKILGGGTDDF